MTDTIIFLLAPLLAVGTLDTLQEFELCRRLFRRVAKSLAGKKAALGQQSVAVGDTESV